MIFRTQNLLGTNLVDGAVDFVDRLNTAIDAKDGLRGQLRHLPQRGHLTEQQAHTIAAFFGSFLRTAKALVPARDMSGMTGVEAGFRSMTGDGTPLDQYDRFQMANTVYDLELAWVPFNMVGELPVFIPESRVETYYQVACLVTSVIENMLADLSSES